MLFLFLIGVLHVVDIITIVIIYILTLSYVNVNTLAAICKENYTNTVEKWSTVANSRKKYDCSRKTVEKK